MTFLGIFHLYGLIIGIAIAVGIYVIERYSQYFKIDSHWLDQALVPIIVGAVVGARLYHLITDWHFYVRASFFDLIAIWRGGVGFLGAIMGGVLGLYFWTWSHSRFEAQNSRLFTYLDVLCFGLPIAQAIGRLGNFVNQELYGLPTSLPWGIVINGQKYHPLFLYEALLNLGLFGILWILARHKSLVLGKGQYLSVYVFGYALIRFWLEFLRPETARLDGVLGIFSTAQWVTLIFMIVATVLFWVRRHAPKKEFDFTLE